MLALHSLRVGPASLVSQGGGGQPLHRRSEVRRAAEAGLLRQDTDPRDRGQLDLAKASSEERGLAALSPQRPGGKGVPLLYAQAPPRLSGRLDRGRRGDARGPRRGPARLLSRIGRRPCCGGANVRWAKVVTHGAAVVDTFASSSAAGTATRPAPGSRPRCTPSCRSLRRSTPRNPAPECWSPVGSAATSLDGNPVGAQPARRSRSDPGVRIPLRPVDRCPQGPARQGTALRRRHRRHLLARSGSRCSRPTSRCPWSAAFIAQIKERAKGAEVSGALNPAQQVVKIVNEELVGILGGETRRLQFAKTPPTVIMLAGLQGSGKTTLAGKLARWLQGPGPHAAARRLRPAAARRGQPAADRRRAGRGAVFAPHPGISAAARTARRVGGRSDRGGRGRSRRGARAALDVVIVDTAGRSASTRS